MKAVPRILDALVSRSAKHYAAIVLTGARRAGKTTLFRNLLPHAEYVLLEDPDIRARATSDPRAFLEDLRRPANLDEIQNVPLLFDYIRTVIAESGSASSVALDGEIENHPYLRVEEMEHPEEPFFRMDDFQ